ncbi:uncharacterized protein LOC136086753 [Hydra vulgaris]|uniref:Uncharacterized protein LOC136086753 n=1 Tax=Hydra vulgaris TaxID=6087 RepID=A0ABM4CTK4_HYDVU
MPIAIMCAEAGISTHKGVSVTRSLSYFHSDIPTPNQSAIFKAGKRLQVTTLLKLKEALSVQLSFILHFDGKGVAPYDYGIKKVERMVITLQSDGPIFWYIGLKTLHTSGTSENLAAMITETLLEYNVVHKISLIICDTCSVNTGGSYDGSGGVVGILRSKLFNRPVPYYGCNAHILDLVLKKMVIFHLPTPSKSPTLTDFKFIQKLKNKYPQLKESYNILHKTLHPPPTVKTWRDDYKLLARFVLLKIIIFNINDLYM